MRISAPLIFGIVLALAGCNKRDPASPPAESRSEHRQAVEQKLDIRPETENRLFNSNQLVCVGGVLYFVSWQDGSVSIKSPVMDPASPNNATLCSGGYPLNRFGRLY